MVGLGLCYTFLLSSLPHSQAYIIDLHTSYLLGVRKKEPFYWDEKVRYTFQSSLGIEGKIRHFYKFNFDTGKFNISKKRKVWVFPGRVL